MQPLRVLAIYITLVFVGGALAAPWIYWLTQAFADELLGLGNRPFHRFVHRSILLLAVLGLWPLLKTIGIASPRDVGLIKPSGQWKKLGGGFALGFASLALIAGLALAAGARSPASDIGTAGKKIVGAAFTAVAVAVLEEILFRGALFGALRTGMNWMTALLLSSMFYAIVHFLESARLTGPVCWYSGVELLPRMLRGFADWHAIIPGFLSLTVAGFLLGLAYQRTGNLYFSIGLHAGWIFWLKSYGFLTRDVAGFDPWLWGTSRLINGWVALPVLGLTLLVFNRWEAGRDAPSL